jgi:hypothetical protein
MLRNFCVAERIAVSQDGVIFMVFVIRMIYGENSETKSPYVGPQS